MRPHMYIFMPFHGGNMGSNPVGDANFINHLDGSMSGGVLAVADCPKIRRIFGESQPPS